MVNIDKTMRFEQQSFSFVVQHRVYTIKWPEGIGHRKASYSYKSAEYEALEK